MGKIILIRVDGAHACMDRRMECSLSQCTITATNGLLIMEDENIADAIVKAGNSRHVVRCKVPTECHHRPTHKIAIGTNQSITTATAAALDQSIEGIPRLLTCPIHHRHHHGPLHHLTPPLTTTCMEPLDMLMLETNTMAKT